MLSEYQFRPNIFDQIQDNETSPYPAFSSKTPSLHFLIALFSELRHSFLTFLTLLEVPMDTCATGTWFAHML